MNFFISKFIFIFLNTPMLLNVIFLSQTALCPENIYEQAPTVVRRLRKQLIE
jgi:hypothetical protein